MFKEFRLLHAAHLRSPSRLALPDSLRLLPLLTLGLLKGAALRGSGKEVPADERIAAGFELCAAPVDRCEG